MIKYRDFSLIVIKPPPFFKRSTLTLLNISKIIMANMDVINNI